MTIAPRRESLQFSSVEEVVEAIRHAGGRVTGPRRLVLEALFSAQRPVSAEAIAEVVGDRSDASSVYRSLELFERLGAVRHFHVAHGAGLYVLDDGRRREFLACEGCGRVDVIDEAGGEQLRALVRERFGYEPSFGHFPVVGLCASCSAAAQAD